MRAGARTVGRAVFRAIVAFPMGRPIGRAASLATATLLLTASVAFAVDPTASPAGGGDVRTNPAAPGLTGDPLVAILGVTIVGLLAVVVTLAAVRLTARR
jgi:hypothetical protein